MGIYLEYQMCEDLGMDKRWLLKCRLLSCYLFAYLFVFIYSTYNLTSTHSSSAPPLSAAVIAFIVATATCGFLMEAVQGGFMGGGGGHRFSQHYPQFSHGSDVAQDPNTVDDSYGWAWGASSGGNNQHHHRHPNQYNFGNNYNPDFNFDSNEFFSSPGQFNGGQGQFQSQQGQGQGQFPGQGQFQNQGQGQFPGGNFNNNNGGGGFNNQFPGQQQQQQQPRVPVITTPMTTTRAPTTPPTPAPGKRLKNWN